MARRRALGRAGLALAFLLVLAWWGGNDALRALEPDAPSVSHGTAADGSLEHGKRLPTAWANVRTYSRLGSLLGRTSVHETVRDVLVDAYDVLGAERPGTVYVYGETGWPSGGPFPPHKTHQSGLSVDLMVPVTDGSGRSVPLPTWPWNRWGYDVTFDGEGQSDDLDIDEAALAALVQAVVGATRGRSIRVRRIIYAPDLQPLLFAEAPDVEPVVAWSERPSWVRHDDHIHIDFELTAP